MQNGSVYVHARVHVREKGELPMTRRLLSYFSPSTLCLLGLFANTRAQSKVNLCFIGEPKTDWFRAAAVFVPTAAFFFFLGERYAISRSDLRWRVCGARSDGDGDAPFSLGWRVCEICGKRMFIYVGFAFDSDWMLFWFIVVVNFKWWNYDLCFSRYMIVNGFEVCNVGVQRMIFYDCLKLLMQRKFDLNLCYKVIWYYKTINLHAKLILIIINWK